MDSPPSPSAEPLSHHVHRSKWFVDEVQPHEVVLRSYLRGAFPAVRDLDDVVQESYLRIWHAGAKQRIKSAKAFLFTVARRLALDSLRRERRISNVEIADLAELFACNSAQGADAAAILAEEVELLVEAIESLPPRCREVFVLRRLQGVSQKDIASRLGLSEQTVQVQAARGLQRCAEFVRRKLKNP